MAQVLTDPSPMTATAGSSLIFGCGYLGSRVAQRLVASGQPVAALTRSAERAGRLAAQGIEPLLGDWTDARQLRQLPPHDRVLVAVAFDRRSGKTRRDVLIQGLRNMLRATDPEADLCYISTTGVYHQQHGQWVDEASPCRPTGDGGRLHLEAEETLRRLRPSCPWTILRLAGIYGPGRLPRSADIIAGRPVAAPGEGYLNLIHVDDAATTVLATWARRRAVGGRCRCYVVSDGCPVVRRRFYQQIALVTASPAPRFVPPPADAPVTARAETNKRVWNAKMRRDLVGRLRYPSFRQGLDGILNP